MLYALHITRFCFATLSILFLISSCTSPKPELKDRAIMQECEKLLKSVLHDSGSYERISFLITDTVRRSEDLSIELQNVKQKPEIALTPWEEEESRQIDRRRDSLTAEINKIKNKPSLDSISFINFEINFKAKDRSGTMRNAKTRVSYYPYFIGRKAWLGKIEPYSMYREFESSMNSFVIDAPQIADPNIKDSIFIRQFDEMIRKPISNEDVYDYLLKNKFFIEKKSSQVEYLYVLKFLLNNDPDETFSESFGLYLYEVLMKYPDKGYKIDSLINMLSEGKKNLLQQKIIWKLTNELQYNEFNESKFREKFPYFKSSTYFLAFKEVRKNWVEN